MKGYSRAFRHGSLVSPALVRQLLSSAALCSRLRSRKLPVVVVVVACRNIVRILLLLDMQHGRAHAFAAAACGDCSVHRRERGWRVSELESCRPDMILLFCNYTVHELGVLTVELFSPKRGNNSFPLSLRCCSATLRVNQVTNDC